MSFSTGGLVRCKPVFVGRTELDYIVEVGNEDQIAHFEPDFIAMKQFPVRGICLTSKSKEEGIDIVSRFFLQPKALTRIM